MEQIQRMYSFVEWTPLEKKNMHKIWDLFSFPFFLPECVEDFIVLLL